MDNSEINTQIRIRLSEIGGRISQDLGAGRIVGQVLIYLYLQEHECSLDSICEGLGLCKASVSIGVRQLEQLSLVRKVWLKGDRKNYYRSADNIGIALQQGLLSFVRQKVQLFGCELEMSADLLNDVSGQDDTREVEFLRQRVRRAGKLQKRLAKVLGNPLVRLLTRAKND